MNSAALIAPSPLASSARNAVAALLISAADTTPSLLASSAVTARSPNPPRPGP